MLERATTIDVTLTPSERDALVFGSKLIKHHRPRYSVLLKDDENYPYICASVGDAFPRLSVVPTRPLASSTSARKRYFGPYTNFKEMNKVMDESSLYDLRNQASTVAITLTNEALLSHNE